MADIQQLFCLLFWYDNERNWSIQNYSTIVKPRRDPEDYKTGDLVLAKFQGKTYKTAIIEVAGLPHKRAAENGHDANQATHAAASNQAAPAVASKGLPQKRTSKNVPDANQADVAPKAKKRLHEENASEKESDATDLIVPKVKAQLYLAEKVKHTNCVARREFDELKEEVRRLRQMLRAIKPSQPLSTPTIANDSPVRASGSDVSTPRISSASSSLGIGAAAENKSSGSLESKVNDTLDLYNGLSRSGLRDLISHMDKPYDGVRVLLLSLFSTEYILTHSVSGKSSNSTKAAKLPFDSRLFSILTSTIKSKFPDVKGKDITEKVHAVQKSLKRKY